MKLFVALNKCQPFDDISLQRQVLLYFTHLPENIQRLLLLIISLIESSSASWSKLPKFYPMLSSFNHLSLFPQFWYILHILSFLLTTFNCIFTTFFIVSISPFIPLLQSSWAFKILYFLKIQLKAHLLPKVTEYFERYLFKIGFIFSNYTLQNSILRVLHVSIFFYSMLFNS